MAFASGSKNNDREYEQKRAFHKAAQTSAHLNSEKRELFLRPRRGGSTRIGKKNFHRATSALP